MSTHHPISPSGAALLPRGSGGTVAGRLCGWGFQDTQGAPRPHRADTRPLFDYGATTTQFPYNAAVVTCAPFCECWVFLFA